MTFRIQFGQVLESRVFVLVCFAVFILVRLALVFLVPVIPESDGAWYLERATILHLRGEYSERGIPTAYWPVGYPAFLAGIFAFTGPSLLAVKLANVVLAGASFWLLYVLAIRLSGNIQVAGLTVLLFTLHINGVGYTPLVLTEVLYVALLLGSAVFLIGSERAWRLVGGGLILGLATLVKTQTIILAPFFALLCLLDGFSLHSFKTAAGRAVLVGLVALLVVLPWSFRNYNVFGSFVLVSTNGGMTLLTGNNPSVVGDYTNNFSESDPLVKEARFSVADQVAADKRASALGWKWIREHPGTFLSLIPKKMLRLWGPDGESEWAYQLGTPEYEQQKIWFRSIRYVNQGFYGLVMLAFAYFSIVQLRLCTANPRLFLGLLLVGFSSALCIVFSGQSRYHYPAMPFIFLMVSWAAVNARRLRLFKASPEGRSGEEVRFNKHL